MASVARLTRRHFADGFDFNGQDPGGVSQNINLIDCVSQVNGTDGNTSLVEGFGFARHCQNFTLTRCQSNGNDPLPRTVHLELDLESPIFPNDYPIANITFDECQASYNVVGADFFPDFSGEFMF